MLRQVVAAATASGTLCGASLLAYCDAEAKSDSKDFRQGMFDPEALERGAKAIREIDRSSNAKQVYEHLRQQELSKQAEQKKGEAEALAQAKAYEAQTEQIRQQEESKREQERAQRHRELMQQQAALEREKLKEQAQMKREQNAEYLQQQKQVSLEVENHKLQVQRQMEAERKATADYEAERAKQVAIEKAMAEGRARALEHRENRDIFMDEISEKAKEWGKQYLILLQESFKNIGVGANLLLTTDLGPKALAGLAGLFAAYYGVRGGFGVAYGQLERYLSTPPLVRETSRYNVLQRMLASVGLGQRSILSRDVALAAADKTFSDIILAPEAKHSIRALAASAANTRLHGAPFRHYLLYGPPGTGKTLVAKRLALTSGLDYAIMSGGDVAPLGANAVKQMHEMFDWAKRSSKGMVLFVDEADAFLSKRDQGVKSEAMRSAINAMLYRTGDQSKDFMVVMATNRPEDLDEAVLDRVDEHLEIALPDIALREEILTLYFNRYITNATKEYQKSMTFVQSLGRMLRGGRGSVDDINTSGLDSGSLLRHAAQQTEGFSGRELAKLMASIQAAAYGTPDATLTPELFNMVLASKVKQHALRGQLQHR